MLIHPLLVLQKLNENFGFESWAALGRVWYGCEILPDGRIACGAFVSAAGSEAGLQPLCRAWFLQVWVQDSVSVDFVGCFTWLVCS